MKMNSKREGRHFQSQIISIFFGLLFGVAASPSAAQITSTIEGVVRDQRGQALAGVKVSVSEDSLAVSRTVTTDSTGFYRVVALPARTYTVTASQSGFARRSFRIELPLNRVLAFDIALKVGAIEGEVTVRSGATALDSTDSSSSSIITPRQTADMPLNGRNYLDLMQLVAGVTVNRQADPGTDTAVAVLGERGGNTNFLLNGLSNQDLVNGGAASQVAQDAVEEFQVITTGYKAEFGRASGGIVNVITKTGANELHGVASLFHRNDAFDASNLPGEGARFLRRWDYGLALGGPVVKDRIFFFGSAERITERRQLNFAFPLNIPATLAARENAFNTPARSPESRFLFKLDEQVGRHRLTQQVNSSAQARENFLPLTQATNLPSTRQDSDAHRLNVGFSDTALVGNQSKPFVLTLRAQFRRETSALRPSHPEAQT